ncbi:MAG TPA: hypothetical protein PK400_03160 [Phycisphaerales bacterium]|nr:hypothetical protein [Phycisphaerales bacterium]HRQ74366.1 hypothetical protein [Phycisphaerales bacterium]
MPVSGLVITLSESPEDRASALVSLGESPCIEVGEVNGSRLPIVVDTPTFEDDRHVWDWLHNLRGVLFVDVACIHFDDEENPQQSEVSL